MRKPAPIQISVPSPCHESWDGMTPVQGGRHCATCRKAVTDFTHMTDRELTAFLQSGAGTGCGRFYADQLNRPIIVPSAPRRSWWMRAAISIGLYFGFGTPVTAQQKAAAPFAIKYVADTAADRELVSRPAHARENPFAEFQHQRKPDLTIAGFAVYDPVLDGDVQERFSAFEKITSIPSLFRRMFPLKKKSF